MTSMYVNAFPSVTAPEFRGRASMHGMSDHLVRVYASTDAIAGALMRGRLEAEGIDAMINGDGDGPYRAGPVYVWVPAEHEQAARTIVAAVGSGRYALEPDADVGRGDEAQPRVPRTRSTPL